MPEEKADTQDQNADTLDQQKNDDGGTKEVNETKENVTPPTWRDGFVTDTYKENDTFKKYATIDDMGKAHLELSSMIGKKGVVLPNDNDPKDMERFLNDLGRPDTPEKYENPQIEIEDEFKQFYSDDKVNSFKEIAHKYGLTQKQFEGITAEYTGKQLEEIKGIISAETEKNNDSKKALMNEWLSDYDANAKRAELALKSFADKIPSEKVDALVSDPDVQKLFFNVAKSISEDQFRKGSGKVSDTTQSLQSFIDSQVKAKQSSYYDQNAPDHKAVKEKVRDAYSKLEELRKVGT